MKITHPTIVGITIDVPASQAARWVRQGWHAPDDAPHTDQVPNLLQEDAL